MAVDIDCVKQVYETISPYVRKTPLVRLEQLDQFLGCEVYAKLENLQLTGSFKIRGALNKALGLSDQERERGLVAASSGNHGKALAYAAKMLGTHATVVVPNTAAQVKVEAIAALGAKIIQCDVSERFKVAQQIAEETGGALVPPYDDEDIMAGQGTISLEIAEQLPEVDAIVTPVSGGGLLGGVALSAKALMPHVKVYGAEPAARPRWTASFAAGEPVTVEAKPTKADALVTLCPGLVTYPYVRDNVDAIADVSEEALLKGAKLLLAEGKILAEFSSCIGIAAAMEKLIPVAENQKVCFVISGGSIALNQLADLK